MISVLSRLVHQHPTCRFRLNWPPPRLGRGRALASDLPLAFPGTRRTGLPRNDLVEDRSIRGGEGGFAGAVG